jgi:hypothetical protein
MHQIPRCWISLAAAALPALVVCVIGSSRAHGETPFGGVRPTTRDAFRQLEEILPTPTTTRTASGAPGHAYWQQRADYEIDVTLDETARTITGTQRITYHNNSPDPLPYLWFQLDQNIFAHGSDGSLAAIAPSFGDGSREESRFSFQGLRALLAQREFDGGFRVRSVTDDAGVPLPHAIVKTMMRIDLPEPLAPGASTSLRMAWDYPINDAKAIRARSGYEVLESDSEVIFEIAQFHPRVAAYTDVNGWHHKQFLGRGEFTLELGDFLVRITAPADHIVAGGGVLMNPEAVLTEAQRSRLADAATAGRPVMVVTADEAKANRAEADAGTKTWVFRADNVRDFAWASSRTFLWDAWGRSQEDGGPDVLCMSYYPIEGEPLWSRYSTQAIAHTIEVFGRHTFPYPYPIAISVNGPVGGMEYPMICFNGPRPEKDGTYTKRSKYGLISVVIHEVGHNWFPMIVNSDERQWTWMDEGLNTFLQFLTEQEWEEDYPSRRGEPRDIVPYMTSADQVPIMTNSESLLQFGLNSYAKPATALNILRETIIGREQFDFAFKQYANRWRFKRPMPADLFRTMEDASGVDLDWFWRGWFYTIDHTDIAIDAVRLYTMDTMDPDIDKPAQMAERDAKEPTITEQRNEGIDRRIDDFPELGDFYNTFDDLDVTEKDRKTAREFLEKLDPWERALLAEKPLLYVLDFRNVGGLVMPIILRVTWADGEQEMVTLPAEIWRLDPDRVSRLMISDRELRSIEIDPFQQTADADEWNNHWPRKPITSRFQLFKEKKQPNPMQDAAKAAEDAAKGADESKPTEEPPADPDEEKEGGRP